jgi:hypothetical protein
VIEKCLINTNTTEQFHFNFWYFFLYTYNAYSETFGTLCIFTKHSICWFCVFYKVNIHAASMSQLFNNASSSFRVTKHLLINSCSSVCGCLYKCIKDLNSPAVTDARKSNTLAMPSSSPFILALRQNLSRWKRQAMYGHFPSLMASWRLKLPI